MDEKEERYLNKFGEKLLVLKKKSGLSYRKIAANCNVEHSDIKRYVDGKINPTLLTIIDLAKGLGVAPKDLLDVDWEEKSQ
ncbi:Helix-turn-helix domain-containing protein [Pedobacter westerhofensis]|uniref:Helix-turn-helix domain-containing protein n=1 Tax=Pedobacter westerhofensis TaxID=425512 RepID=A0A521DPL3_9SPHI|nr:helix-turn-helix transcriptional regulator [Pedobacter westerhofensis]SMO73578.1 Helix-turn-helix domain-containing protein [Pedobacter westerhofensis]